MHFYSKKYDLIVQAFFKFCQMLIFLVFYLIEHAFTLSLKIFAHRLTGFLYMPVQRQKAC